MKLWLLTQSDNTGYDTFDACIVCAETEEDAKTIAPDGGVYKEPTERQRPYTDWANSLESIQCELIGEAINQKRGVIIASFNAAP